MTASASVLERALDAVEAWSTDMRASGQRVEPVAHDVADVRDAVEPLRPATERLGSIARRLPRRRSN
jgi:hypothetical protein